MGSALSHVSSVRWGNVLERDTLITAGGTFIAALAVIGVIKKLTGPKLPPQPFGLPLIGHLNVFGRRPMTSLHLTLKELADKYGEIFMLNVFGIPMVYLNTPDAVKEAYHTHGDFMNNRPQHEIIDMATYGGKGIIWHGQTWRESRRFALTALRDLGFGKQSVADKIVEEGQEIIKVFDKHGGQVFDPSTVLHEGAANIIFSICFGSRFEYTDKKFRDVVELLDENMKRANTLNFRLFLFTVFPFTRYFLSLPSNFVKQLEITEKIEIFMAAQVTEHRETFDSNNIRDLIDLYLQKELEGNKDHPVYSENNTYMIIRDLLHTGTETTATSISWGFLYLINYPNVQEKIHHELDQVVGSGRWPSLEDRPNMPYLHATLLELLRISNLAPLVVPHIATKDVTVSGYTIPKDSTVLANLYAIQMSEKYWEEPETFRPERFLSKDGQIITKEAFMAFGSGPRQCLGETLARSELFLFMAMILQKFRIQGEDDVTKPSLEGKMGITLSPIAVKIRAIPR